MADIKREVRSWVLYDWANSAFATTIMAGFFPTFFKQYWSAPGEVARSTFYLGLANSIASIVIALLAPVLGAIADRGSAKKKLLFTFSYLGILMTAGLSLVAQGNWVLAAIIYVFGTIGFSAGNIFYDSLLVSVASRKKVDFVSSLGFSMGYLGGGLLFLINVIMYLKPEIFGIADGTAAIKISFITVAVWWAVFSIPIYLFVKEEKSDTPKKGAVLDGLKQLAHTFKEIRKLKVVFLFLIAYWFYIDAVDTIIKMAVDYGLSLGFPSESLIIALLLVQFIAFPAALLYNLFASKIGVKRALVVAIIAYGIITIFGYFMQMVWHFYVLAALVGLFQGGIQALSRSYYTRLIPKGKAAEFFGFYNMLGKFATVIGPFLMGTVTIITGNNRLGILSIIILLIIGGFLLIRVNESEGEKLADELERT